MDFFKNPGYLDPYYTFEETKWISLMINQLTVFMFLGFLVAYLVYRYRIMPQKTLKNSVTAALAFFLTLKYLTPLASSLGVYAILVPFMGLMAGIGVCIWGVASYWEFFKISLKDSH